MPHAATDTGREDCKSRGRGGTIHLRQLPTNKGDDMKRIYRWLRGLLRENVIGSRIDTYDRSCIRAAASYDRQDRYLRTMERQS